MGWYILGLIIALVIQGIIATKFAAIADEKGYYGSSYFWLCFLLGAIGYCMVAALPDLALHNKINNLSKSNQDIVKLYKSAQAPIMVPLPCFIPKTNCWKLDM